MIISCGEALIDFVPQVNGNYKPCPGGSPYNLCIALSRLGVPAGFLCKISRDFLGDMLFERLKSEKVDCRYIQRSEQPTTLAFVKIEEGMEPRYAFFANDSADRNLLPADVPENFPDDVECLNFGSISMLMSPQSDTIRQLVERESRQRIVSFDPNVRPVMIPDRKVYIEQVHHWVRLSAVARVSFADLEWLYPERSVQESAERWLAMGPKLVALTCGKDGGRILTPSFQVEEPGYYVEVADTIGAGDTFHAALLARLRSLGKLSHKTLGTLSRSDAADCLRFAVKASALNCSRVGADPPDMHEMERL